MDVVCITNGDKGIPGCTHNHASEIRHNEFVNAMSRCGVTRYYWLGVPDGGISEALHSILNLPLDIYSYIAIPNWLDTHRDHCALAHLIAKAYTMGNISCRTKIIFYEVWNALPLPTHFVDLTNLIEKKSELIREYRSQIRQIDYSAYIKQLNAYRGMAVGTEYAEAYTIVPISWLDSLL